MNHDPDYEPDEMLEGMGENFWLGVCNGLGVMIATGFVALALWQIGMTLWQYVS